MVCFVMFSLSVKIKNDPHQSNLMQSCSMLEMISCSHTEMFCWLAIEAKADWSAAVELTHVPGDDTSVQFRIDEEIHSLFLEMKGFTLNQWPLVFEQEDKNDSHRNSLLHFMDLSE